VNTVNEPIVLGTQLRSARRSLALSVEEAAQGLGVKPSHLQAWESGESEPSLEDLWRVAELYARNLDYFLQPAAAPPTRFALRLPKLAGLRDLPMSARRVIAEFDELCRAATELELVVGGPAKVKVPRGLAGSDASQMASEERQRLGLDDRPVRGLRLLLERQGVRLFELTVPDDAFSGLSWWHEDYGPCILVNAHDTVGRRSFTMTHEYAHLLTHDRPFLCSLDVVSRRDERFANSFAVAFLMPASDVVRAFRRRGLGDQPISDRQLASLSSRYSVSLEAMARRLEELRLIAPGTVESLILQWKSRPKRWARSTTPKWRRRVGERFSNTVLEAHRRGEISIGKVAEYLNLDVRKAMEVVAATSAQASLDREL
jgi:Zn-dependent peptidase ImmA (M78 family)/transcriptional regulator with XRE-family HTH domain